MERKSLVISNELYEKLKAFAEKNSLSPSTAIRFILAKFFNDSNEK